MVIESYGKVSWLACPHCENRLPAEVINTEKVITCPYCDGMVRVIVDFVARAIFEDDEYNYIDYATD